MLVAAPPLLSCLLYSAPPRMFFFALRRSLCIFSPLHVTSLRCSSLRSLLAHHSGSNEHSRIHSHPHSTTTFTLLPSPLPLSVSASSPHRKQPTARQQRRKGDALVKRRFLSINQLNPPATNHQPPTSQSVVSQLSVVSHSVSQSVIHLSSQRTVQFRQSE
jgi:hypothetical protein